MSMAWVRSLWRALLLVVLAITPGRLAVAAAEYYVAPNGDDANPGTLDRPFASLERARDAIRGIKADGPLRPGGVTVFLRGGDYYLKQPFELTPRDSGAPGAPITYRNYKDEAARLSGGSLIGPWRRGDANTWTARVPQTGDGPASFRQLYVAPSGQTHFTRRYRPDRGMFTVAGLTSAPARPSTMRHRQAQDEFIFAPGDLAPAMPLADIELVVLHSWSSSRLRIREIDPPNRVVRFTGFPVYRIGHWYKDGKNPYYVENVADALSPGRWFLDAGGGELRYRPLEGESVESMRFVAPRLEQLVRLIGDGKAGAYVEHVAFRGLTFSHTGWSLPEKGYVPGQGMVDLPGAIHARYARGCVWERCTIANVGGYAIDLGEGCQDNRVTGCRMFDLGGGGVKVGVIDAKAQPPALPGGNIVENCVITDGSVEHFSAHGIWVGIARGTKVRHNLVRRFLYSGVSVGWKWDDTPTACGDNLIEANHIHDCLLLLADGGCIYTLGAQPGTTLRANYLHHTPRHRFAAGSENNGIFLDQGSKGYTVERNVMHDTTGKPIRFNQSKQDLHTFGSNHLGPTATAPAWATEVMEQAGLEPAYADLAQGLPACLPPPVLGMTLAPRSEPPATAPR